MSVNNHVLLDVIEIFEDFLEEKGVTIPNPEKEEADIDGCAQIYGTDFDRMMERIRETLSGYFSVEIPDTWEDQSFMVFSEDAIIDMDTIGKALEQYCLETGRVFSDYMIDTAQYLVRQNIAHKLSHGENWFLPEALVPLTCECWKTLNELCERDGVKYDLAFSDAGMVDILYKRKLYAFPDWALDSDAFDAYVSSLSTVES